MPRFCDIFFVEVLNLARHAVAEMRLHLGAGPVGVAVVDGIEDRFMRDDCPLDSLRVVPTAFVLGEDHERRQ